MGSITMTKKKTKQPDPKPSPVIAPAVKGASVAGWHNISTFLRCPKEFQLSQVRGISTPRTQQPDPLAIGSLFHEGRSHWFQSGFPTGLPYWEKLKKYINKSADTSNPPIRIEAINRTLSYLEQYCSYWSMRALPTPVLVEKEVGPAPLAKDDPFHLFRTFRPDDISRYPEVQNNLCIGECKTTSVGIDDAVNEYTLHGQPMMQQIIWSMAKNGAAMYGEATHVLLDVIVKGYGKEKCKFGRHAIPFTQFSQQWYIQSMRGYLRASQMIEYDTDVPRNITACTRLVGRARVPCQFRALCQFGKSAAARYVDRDGNGLANPKYKDYPVKPWE